MMCSIFNSHTDTKDNWLCCVCVCRLLVFYVNFLHKHSLIVRFIFADVLLWFFFFISLLITSNQHWFISYSVHSFAALNFLSCTFVVFIRTHTRMYAYIICIYKSIQFFSFCVNYMYSPPIKETERAKKTKYSRRGG